VVDVGKRPRILQMASIAGVQRVHKVKQEVYMCMSNGTCKLVLQPASSRAIPTGMNGGCSFNCLMGHAELSSARPAAS
jgi:hypothetical protein